MARAKPFERVFVVVSAFRFRTVHTTGYRSAQERA